MLKRLLILAIFVFFLADGSSARDLRAVKIQKYLERYPWSPLRGHEQEIVYCADLFKIDYRLYLAVAAAESTYGKRFPKQSKNLTGYNNCRTGFVSIYQNIYETSRLIGTRSYYRKYRETKNIKDLIVVYKAVPPFDHYIRNMRYVLDSVTAVSVEKEKREAREMRASEALAIIEPEDFYRAKMIEAMRKPLYTWNSMRYDLYPCGRNIAVEMKIANKL